MKKLFLTFVFALLAHAAFAIDITKIKEVASKLASQGKYKEAAEFLEKSNAGESKDMELRFFYAQCCVATEQLEKAAAIYQSMLDENPNLPRVRLELASVDARLNKIREAKEQYTLVLNSNPPDTVKRNILLQLHALESQKNWSLRASAGYIYDTNANAGPTANSVQLFGAPFSLDSGDRPKADSGAQVNLEAAYRLPLGQSLYFVSNLAYSQVTYFKEWRFDYSDLQFMTGPGWVGKLSGKQLELDLQAIYDVSWFGKKFYGQNFGIAPRFTVELSPRWSITQGVQVQHDIDKLTSGRTGLAATYNAALRWTSKDGSFIQPRFFYGRESTQASYLSDNQYGLGLGIYLNLPWKFTAFVEPVYHWTLYDSEDPAFGNARNDGQFLINANLAHDLGFWGVQGAIGYTYTNNGSNIDFFSYDRHQLTFQISKLF